MNLKDLNDFELHSQTQTSAVNEKLATTKLLHHLREIEKRRLFAVYSCDSLHAYCMRHLHFSDKEASIRVNASRLLRDCPEIEEKINSGEMTLSTASQAQAFFKKESKAGNELSRETKSELLKDLHSKSTRKVEQVLMEHSTLPAEPIREKLKVVTRELSELKIAIDEETLQNLNRLREIWSHTMPGATYGDLIKKMADLPCQSEDPLLKAERSETKDKEKAARTAVQSEPTAAQKHATLSASQSTAAGKHATQSASRSAAQPKSTVAWKHGPQSATQSISAQTHGPQSASQPKSIVSRKQVIRPKSTSAQKHEPQSAIQSKPKTRTRHIPAHIECAVWLRDQGQCTYVGPDGAACRSKHKVQSDHIIPFAQCGANTIENLRLRCFAHNQLHALYTYGRHAEEFMRQ